MASPAWGAGLNGAGAATGAGPRQEAPRVRVGCAGWSIASRHAPLFGEGDSHLMRYATRFDAVEINSTFYRPHRPATFERWAGTVPAGFRFSVKLPRHITHEARLVCADDALSRFFDQVNHLGPKLGGVLVQLPPSLGFDAGVAERFFAMLRRYCAAPVACEPRHLGWFGAAADRLWESHAVVRVAADPARWPAAARPGGPVVPSRWSYWRWHGSPRMYFSPYDDATLGVLAAALDHHAHARAPAWCILDNTADGHAVADAARLQTLLAVRQGSTVDGGGGAAAGHRL